MLIFFSLSFSFLKQKSKKKIRSLNTKEQLITITIADLWCINKKTNALKDQSMYKFIYEERSKEKKNF